MCGIYIRVLFSTNIPYSAMFCNEKHCDIGVMHLLRGTAHVTSGEIPRRPRARFAKDVGSACAPITLFGMPSAFAALLDLSIV
jgi:hypothetical protein